MKSRCSYLILSVIVSCLLAAIVPPKLAKIQRPRDTWAIRSVLDKKPRMLTLALDSACYVAYDLAQCTLYKVWKGGVSLDGAPYTDQKTIQPTSWGTAYVPDSLLTYQWVAESGGKNVLTSITNKGYAFRNNQIYLKYRLTTSLGDTITVEERPEFIRSNTGKPGLERVFTLADAPTNVTVLLKSRQGTIPLSASKVTQSVTYFQNLPPQRLPLIEEKFAHRGQYLIEKSDCSTCHEIDEPMVGPSFRQIAARYGKEKDVVSRLIRKVREGGTGVWGSSVMNPHPALAENDVRIIIDYIFTLKPKGSVDVASVTQKQTETTRAKPGYGAEVEGVHPSYELTTLHRPDFQPRVGGLAFLPDGRLLVTTWDTVGGVYVLDRLTTGNPRDVRIKRIASGLAEPLGITVVNGQIYVLQKHELTRLVDRDGDDVIDDYQAVCNTWGVSADFHEFAFGLVYKDAYFYITLSMAMRLKPGELQQLDRGRTIKIGMDGRYEWVNYGLRTPNGIGLGPDRAIFVTDNQGQWLPGNKLIHIKPGEYHGMGWGLLNSNASPPMAQPAIWLPENEIANSPSEPILMQDGPYKGQLLHGDVTHGGIKRDFLEKVAGEYQGAVFRFSQGFEAGVNRLCWGPDGALYVGEVGMAGGGWSWREKRFGLQRLKYNGKTTFEMLAIRAKHRGFELEFTEPLSESQSLQPADFFVQQWWYKPTPNYGGPKMDLKRMNVTRLNMSKDRTWVSVEIPGLETKHVFYIRLPDHLKSAGGQSLWSSEAWYTLNNIPPNVTTPANE
ncbi:c-type cytochrome [Spirosoma sp.]|uniref:c-type cytochrome n=1 Tax=Spirosoma sp. TaxID=1899569 RepID=UPI003B3A5608